MAVIANSVYLVGYNFMGQGLVREPLQLLIVHLHLLWKSNILAYVYFQEFLLTPRLYLVLNFFHVLIKYYFKIRLIILLYSVPV
jgi:hypothetical protein